MPVFFCQILSNIHRLYSAMCGITGAWRGCVMKVSVSKWKNQTIYYLSKSVWIDGIISINQKRWQIEKCFRIMKSEFQARPVYLSRKDWITAHFITCFTALILYRILEKKLGESYTTESIIRTLKEMNMLIAPDEGYIPEYTRTDLTDKLHDAFSFRTDYEVVSQREIKKILTATRK